jgi:hypothetical protein
MRVKTDKGRVRAAELVIRRLVGARTVTQLAAAGCAARAWLLELEEHREQQVAEKAEREYRRANPEE